jgi:hypothetical protein
MRFAGNFHPEWGYLAPAPSFMRTARVVAVATAIGATAGAAVVLSLAGSSTPGPTPGVQADAGNSFVVVHSLVQPAEAATAVALPSATPVVAAAPVTVPSAATEPVQANIKANAQAASGALVPPPPAAQVSAPAASESRTASTPVGPASVAALAEIPPVTEASPAPAADQASFAPDQAGAIDNAGKKQRAADQATQHGAQAAVAPAKRKPEERGLAPLLRHLFSARAGTSYYPN